MRCGKLRLLVPADPAFKPNLEDSRSRPRQRVGGRVFDAAHVERVGKRRGKGCELDQLPLLEICVRRNDGLASSRQMHGALGGTRPQPRRLRLPRRLASGSKARWRPCSTRRSFRAPAPENRTSRLSAKCLKNVRSVRPARLAISATVVSGIDRRGSPGSRAGSLGCLVRSAHGHGN